MESARIMAVLIALTFSFDTLEARAEDKIHAITTSCIDRMTTIFKINQFKLPTLPRNK
jgi:hypothetical protein